jgi:hypothetical protein
VVCGHRLRKVRSYASAMTRLKYQLTFDVNSNDFRD